MGTLLNQSKDPPSSEVLHANNKEIWGLEAANAINIYIFLSYLIGEELADKINPSINQFEPMLADSQLDWTIEIKEEEVGKEIEKILL